MAKVVQHFERRLAKGARLAPALYAPEVGARRHALLLGDRHLSTVPSGVAWRDQGDRAASAESSLCRRLLLQNLNQGFVHLVVVAYALEQPIASDHDSHGERENCDIKNFLLQGRPPRFSSRRERLQPIEGFRHLESRIRAPEHRLQNRRSCPPIAMSSWRPHLPHQ